LEKLTSSIDEERRRLLVEDKLLYNHQNAQQRPTDHTFADVVFLEGQKKTAANMLSSRRNFGKAHKECR